MSEERPVHCNLCGEQMYYSNDVRHEPEVAIRVTDTSIGDKTYWEMPHVHEECWNEVRERISEIVRELRGKNTQREGTGKEGTE